MTVAVERQTNRRTLVAFYAAGCRAGSARLVRGSSRRMTTMRSRPAYIRVINRRRSRSVATDVACPESETTRRQRRGLTGRSISGGRCSIQLSYWRRRCARSNLSLAQGVGDSGGDDGVAGREDAARGHSDGGAGARDHDPCGPVQVADDVPVALRMALSGMVPSQFVGKMCLFY